MKLREFRIGWRILLQERAYSAVVICGLAIGLAGFFLLLSFVQYSFSYDSQAPESDQIYVLKHKMNLLDKPQWMELMPLAFKDVLERSGLTQMSVAVVDRPGSIRVADRVQELKVFAVDPSFRLIFGILPIEGDLQTSLIRPDAIALTQDAALKLFGTAHGIGRTVQIDGVAFTVSSILPTPPSNTTLRYDALLSMQNAAWPEDERQRSLSDWGNLGGKIYFKLDGKVAPDVVSQLLQDASDKSPFHSKLPAKVIEQLGEKKLMEIRIGALRDAYFDKDVATSLGSGTRGDKRIVFGAAIIAALILALAMTNYINLATIRTVRRQREIAVRKILGASAGRIVRQFLAESLLVSIIATVLGLILAMLMLPIFSDLVNRRLEGMISITSVLYGLLIGAVVGILAGIYPAWVALHLKVSQVLSGRDNSENSSGLLLRRILTVLQFSTAIALASVTLAIAWQTDFATKVNPGFDASQYLSIDLANNMKQSSSRSFRDALVRIPGVLGVAESMDTVGRAKPLVGWEMQVPRRDGGIVTMRAQDTGVSYFDVYGVKPVAGRLFESEKDNEANSSNIIINMTAARMLGFALPENAIGEPVNLSGEKMARQIVGVVPDLRYQTMREPVQPMLYKLGFETRVLTVHYSGGMATIQQAVEGLWRQHFPDEVLHMSLEQTYFAERYADDTRLTKLFTIATLLTVAIAAFGIHVLSAYSVQRRTREIVLRKLYGASRGQIVMCFGREFFVLILISAALAIPVAAFFIQQYLASFVERAPIGGWTLVASFAAALLIALAATLRHILQALKIVPAQVLRS